MQARQRSYSHSESDTADDAIYAELDPAVFRKRLMSWYRQHARELPWRGITDPYRTWVSEVMLQQTRVAAVVEHYHAFLRRFPTILALALATEDDVLAAWSGLGYYRRARMLHKAAKFITEERGGVLPSTAAELRTLPGIGNIPAPRSPVSPSAKAFLCLMATSNVSCYVCWGGPRKEP